MSPHTDRAWRISRRKARAGRTQRAAGRHRSTLSALIAVGALASSGWCSAGNGRIDYRLYTQDFDPQRPSLTSTQGPKLAGTLAGGLSSSIGSAWTRYLGVAVPGILQTVQKANWVKPGYTLYNARLNIGGIDSIDVVTRNPPGQNSIPSVDASHPMLVIHSGQARLDAMSTTDISGYPNPSFHITFDITVKIHVGLGPMASTATVSGADVEFANAAYVPDNQGAQLGVLADALRNLFGAQAISTKITDGINSNTINITGYLRKYVQDETANLTSNYLGSGWVAAGVFLDQDALSFVVAPRLVPNATGQMTGTLTVSGTQPLAKAGAAPGSCAGAFGVHDTVQIQPAYLASLNPVAFMSTPPPTQALDSQIRVSGGTVTPGSGGWSCQYTVGGLAQGYANNISFNAGASGTAAGPSYHLAPGLSVDFESCRISGSKGPTYHGSACLTQNICSSPLDVPPSPGAACNLIAQTTVSAGRAGSLQQTQMAQPAPNTGDPAAKATTSATVPVLPAAAVSNAARAATTPNWSMPAASSASSVGAAAAGGSLRTPLQQQRALAPAQGAAPGSLQGVR